jgi:REP element-mobilizing transposase RayT
MACHLVCSTKHRLPLMGSEEDCETILLFMAHKARELEGFVEEAGGWREHVHLLLQFRPTQPVTALYGQMKGFSATMWRRRFPDRPFKWEDGVFLKTVDPDRADDLRVYIRQQWQRHESGLVVAHMEPSVY